MKIPIFWIQSLISPVLQWTFKGLLFLSLSGCALFASKERAESFGPRSRVYTGEFEKVWQATQKAMAKYPLRINNMDVGLLETDFIKGDEMWSPPHKPKKVFSGRRYKLRVQVIKGKSAKLPSSKVTIEKKMTRKRDFFAEPEKLPSDGLEELSLLYRIKRQLVIDRALERANKKENS